jgi:hypothetical protein
LKVLTHTDTILLLLISSRRSKNFAANP